MRGFDVPHKKQSVYFTDEVLALLDAEAKRLDRPRHWVVRKVVAANLAAVIAEEEKRQGK